MFARTFTFLTIALKFRRLFVLQNLISSNTTVFLRLFPGWNPCELFQLGLLCVTLRSVKSQRDIVSTSKFSLNRFESSFPLFNRKAHCWGLGLNSLFGVWG